MFDLATATLANSRTMVAITKYINIKKKIEEKQRAEQTEIGGDTDRAWAAGDRPQIGSDSPGRRLELGPAVRARAGYEIESK